MWFADFETEAKETNAEVYLGYIESIDSSHSCLFLSIQELFDYLVSLKLKTTHEIYFHNLTYDGEFLIWFLINQGFEPVIKKVERAGQFKESTDWLGKRAEIYVNYKGYKIRFMCSLRIFPYSVKDIGDSLGFPKLKIEHNIGRHYNSISEIPREVIQYVKRDVEIIKAKYIDYSQYYEIRKTASSCSWYSFKKWYAENYGEHTFKNEYTISKEIYDDLLPAYFGGLTILRPELKGKLLEETVSYYDINSSYPSVFVDELLPYGLPCSTKPQGESVKLIKAVISNITKKDPRMCSHLHNWAKLGQARENYLDEYKGALFVIYTDKEFLELQKTYNFDILSQEDIYFKATRNIGGFIKEKYIAKETAKNEVERLDHKRIINSFTGKFGQCYKHMRRDLVKATEEDKLKYHYGDYVYKLSMDEAQDVKYLPIAIFTTSYARVKLIQAVRENLDSWVYGDTDSLVIRGDKINGINIDDKKLGYWKHVGVGDKFKALKNKCYIIQFRNEDGTTTLKKTIAGLVEDKKDYINFDNFYNGSIIENADRKRKKVKGGYMLKDTDFKL